MVLEYESLYNLFLEKWKNYILENSEQRVFSNLLGDKISKEIDDSNKKFKDYLKSFEVNEDFKDALRISWIDNIKEREDLIILYNDVYFYEPDDSIIIDIKSVDINPLEANKIFKKYNLQINCVKSEEHISESYTLDIEEEDDNFKEQTEFILEEYEIKSSLFIFRNNKFIFNFNVNEIHESRVFISQNLNIGIIDSPNTKEGYPLDLLIIINDTGKEIFKFNFETSVRDTFLHKENYLIVLDNKRYLRLFDLETCKVIDETRLKVREVQELQQMKY